jgi:hypothetical protein
MKPRAKYFATTITGFSILAALGVALHFAATVRSTRRLRDDIRLLEARVDALEQFARTAESDFLHVREIGVSSNIQGTRDNGPTALPPRLLGRGRSGSWMYSDLRLPNGEVRRYYCRTNATPAQLLALVSTIRADMVDASVVKQREGAVDPSE